jgi:site-specific recombinase XerD
MNRNLGRGVDALATLPIRRVPAPLAGRARRPLREHIAPWLFWTEHARGLAPNTVLGYGLDAKMFAAFCDQIGIVYAEEVTYQVIEAFGASLKGGLGQQASSVARRYSALKQLFRFLIREGVVATNPVDLAIRMNLPPRKPPEFMTMEERELIFRTLGGRPDLAGQRHYTLSLFLFYSGLREAETVNLKVEDVHLDPPEKAYLRVRDGKGMKDRLVPIVPRLREALRVYLATTRPGLNPPTEKPWLFIHCRNRGRQSLEPLHPKALWHFVEKIIRPIVKRKVGVHTFRHSYATHVYEGSGDLNLIKSLLGHSSINTTAIYAHVTPTKQREKLAEFLK